MELSQGIKAATLKLLVFMNTLQRPQFLQERKTPSKTLLLWMAGVGKTPIWKVVEMIWTSANERFLTCKIPRSF
ncbi:Uncharacterized protein HZ326_28674 [Fusarium oxysporum f. sp. albedinis]|nr:Uncharacterized protein HZ326_28674 [Fusarium oxysporum f. sp. albedinis]